MVTDWSGIWWQPWCKLPISTFSAVHGSRASLEPRCDGELSWSQVHNVRCEAPTGMENHGDVRCRVFCVVPETRPRPEIHWNVSQAPKDNLLTNPTLIEAVHSESQDAHGIFILQESPSWICYLLAVLFAHLRHDGYLWLWEQLLSDWPRPLEAIAQAIGVVPA